MPWQRAFRVSHREAYDELLADDPCWHALADNLWRPRRGAVPGWMADFLTLPPLGAAATFADELASSRLGRRADPRRRPVPATGAIPAGARPQRATGGGLGAAHLGLDRDRGCRLASSTPGARGRHRLAHPAAGDPGLGRCRPDAGHRIDWRPGGELQINSYDLPTRDLAQARELSFVPVHANGSWVAWELPWRFAVVYPVGGAQAAEDRPVRARARRLVGPNRARLLALLDEPRSTTQLAALTLLPVGAVGNHLRVLLDAGAVLRGVRAGRCCTGGRRWVMRWSRRAGERGSAWIVLRVHGRIRSIDRRCALRAPVSVRRRPAWRPRPRSTTTKETAVYAIVRAGAKQQKVTVGDVIEIDTDLDRRRRRGLAARGPRGRR